MCVYVCLYDSRNSKKTPSLTIFALYGKVFEITKVPRFKNHFTINLALSWNSLRTKTIRRVRNRRMSEAIGADN